MSNHFKLKSKVNLEELPIGSQLSESDFALTTPSGIFVQFEHVSETKDRPPYIVEPGIWSIIERSDVLSLEKTSFVKEDILTSFCHTETITSKINCFFNKFHVYKKYGIEVPKRGILLYGPPGCHAKDTEILMFDGSCKKVQDIVINDLLMGPNSKPRQVLKLAHGQERMVEISPIKGESFIVNENHILHLTPSGEDSAFKFPINITVKNYIEKLSNTQKSSYKLTRTGIDFNEKLYNVPPYILGLWLGDGTSVNSSLTTMNKELKQEWINYGVSNDLNFRCQKRKIDSKAETIYLTSKYPSRKQKNHFQNFIRTNNLIKNKHIPLMYLTGSRQQRLELLAGLIDTDGSMSCNGFDYITKSEQLAKNIQYLVRSLGLFCKIKKSEKSCYYKNIQRKGLYYRLWISGNCDIVPVRLTYKKALPRQQRKGVLKTGFNYKYLPVDNYYGFALDQDHLYLTSDFIIHHNTGKTSSIKLVANNYVKDNVTAIVVWPTDRIGASDVKDFIKTFQYKGIEKLILIAEDLGGVEVDEVKVKSQSSLLSLLDNQEKTFNIPVLILATTNHPEIFGGALTNRPGRFSDKIEVGYPNAAARKELFKFYLKESATDELLEKISEKKYEKFSPAHIQEILLRSEIYDLSVMTAVDEILEEIGKYEKMFQNSKRQIGLERDYDYD